MAAIKTLKDTATDDKGVRWWKIDVDTPDAKGNTLGWACETGHLQSPWEWPGFAIISETAQLVDLHGKQLTDERLESAEDKDDLKAKAERAKEGELFQTVYDVIDVDKSASLTTDELRAALKKPWLAQTISRLIARYESEWGGEIAKWDALDGHMGDSVEDWTKEKERIKALQWWSELAGKHGFPESPKAYHFHPAGLLANFPNARGLITIEMLRMIFADAPEERLRIVADGINANIDDGKLDSEERMTHFFGQVRQEVGARMAFRESLRYSSDGLFTSKLSYYRGNKERSDRDANNEEAIANNAYDDANRSKGYKLGNTQTGDGWLYRGRGLKQLTGRANYKGFTTTHARIWGETIDFEANPDRVSEPIYAVRSGLGFWVDKRLYIYADTGIIKSAADNITRGINSETDSYAERWGFVQEIWKKRIFESVF